MFVDGEFLDYTFPTEPEPVSVIAQVILRGDTIEFRELAVYCGPGRDAVPLGVRVLLGIVRHVSGLARQAGYRYLVVTGDRHTGANPYRDVMVRRRL